MQIKVFIRVSLSNIFLLHPFVPDAILWLVTLSLQSVESRLINQDQIQRFSAGPNYFAASTKQFFPQSLMKYQSPHINSLQNFRTTPFISFRQIGSPNRCFLSESKHISCLIFLSSTFFYECEGSLYSMLSTYFPPTL